MFDRRQWLISGPDKEPVSPHDFKKHKGIVAGEYFVNYDEALRVCEGRSGYIPAYYLTADDPYIFFDIDKCVGTPLEQEFLNIFKDFYVERSRSGDGYHALGRCDMAFEKTFKHRGCGVEWYRQSRLTYITGDAITPHSVDKDITAVAAHWIALKFPRREASAELDNWTHQAVPEYLGPADDDELIKKALKSSSPVSMLGARADFKDLWYADGDKLAAVYPDGDGGYDRSRADSALASHLSFWTGKNCERIKTLMLQSSLARPKWDTHKTYLRDTILGACAVATRVLGADRKKEADARYDAPSDSSGLRWGEQLITADKLSSHFNGCVYIASIDRIINDAGVEFSEKQFKNIYGGFKFQLDAQGTTTPDAWRAFTQSQVANFPKFIDTICAPESEEKHIIKNGLAYFNTWKGFAIPPAPGDVTPFIKHVEKLIDDENDRLIFLSYLAAIIQYPGRKFTWCPVLQGTKGNGKSFCAELVASILGVQWCHWPRNATLAKDFNSWMKNRLFAIIEEVRVGARRDVLTQIGPLITNRHVELEGKGADQKTVENRCNWIMFTNYIEDLPSPGDGERRYAPIITAQQSKEDKINHGMTSEYFRKLWRWVDAENGVGAVHDFLRNFEIPVEFNPAEGAVEAPRTSRLDDVIHETRDSMTDLIEEIIDNEIVGCQAGWVSTMALACESRKRGKSCSGARLARILRALGYIKHPALEKSDGKVSASTLIDGGRTRLYIRPGHASALIACPHQVRQTYIDQQSGA